MFPVYYLAAFSVMLQALVGSAETIEVCIEGAGVYGQALSSRTKNDQDRIPWLPQERSTLVLDNNTGTAEMSLQLMYQNTTLNVELELSGLVDYEQCFCYSRWGTQYANMQKKCTYHFYERRNPDLASSLMCVKCENNQCQIAKNTPGAPVPVYRDWNFYEVATGEITGPGLPLLRDRIKAFFPNVVEDQDKCTINIDNLPLPQLHCSDYANPEDGYGFGVNGKNQKCGMSMWFRCEEDNIGKEHSLDINIDFITCPTLVPTSSPTFSPTSAPTSTPTASPTKNPTKCTEQDDVYSILFGEALITENNLGGFCGTGTQAFPFNENLPCGAGGCGVKCPQRLVYENIGSVNGKDIKLVVTATGEYDARLKNGVSVTGVSGKFGMINLRNHAHANFTFELVYADGSPDPVFENLVYTFFDLDSGVCTCPGSTLAERCNSTREGKCSKNNKECNQEIFSIYPNEYPGIVASRGPDTDVCEDVDGDIIHFTSTVEGYAKNNPTDPLTLNAEQKRYTVAVTLKNTNSFTFRYDNTAGKLNAGRNIVFAGLSNLKECV